MLIRNKKKIVADDEIMEQPVDQVADEDVAVEPAAAEMLFEAEDVADILAEVTGQPITVEVADDASQCVIGVGDDEFTIDAEDAEEINEGEPAPAEEPEEEPVVESKKLRGKSVQASSKLGGKVIKRVPSKK